MAAFPIVCMFVQAEKTKQSLAQFGSIAENIRSSGTVFDSLRWKKSRDQMAAAEAAKAEKAKEEAKFFFFFFFFPKIVGLRRKSQCQNVKLP